MYNSLSSRYNSDSLPLQLILAPNLELTLTNPGTRFHLKLALSSKSHSNTGTRSHSQSISHSLLLKIWNSLSLQLWNSLSLQLWNSLSLQLWNSLSLVQIAITILFWISLLLIHSILPSPWHFKTWAGSALAYTLDLAITSTFQRIRWFHYWDPNS